MSNSPKYLFKEKNAYGNMSEALHIFPFYTGNKGNIYSIRGLGQIVYAEHMALNKIKCAALDSAKEAMSVKYTAPSEKGITQLPIINAGPYSFLPPSMQPVADQKAPDLSRIAMPAIEMLQQGADSKSATSTLSSVFNNAPDRRSSAEAQAAVEHFNSLNSAAMLLWSRTWRDLIVECAKRAFRPLQNEFTPSGRAAASMHRACVARGVPEELFCAIDYDLTKTAIPVGPGSKSARMLQRQQGAALYGSMDVPGRKAFDRDFAIDIFGVEKASEYINFNEKPRETYDHALARLENNDLIEGQEIKPSPSENFLVHLNIHIEVLLQYVQQVEEGEMELIPATREMYGLYMHTVETFELAVVPELADDELDAVKQRIQQIGEYVNNGLRAIKAEERKMAEEGAPEEGQEGGEQTEKMQELQIKQMEAEQKMQIAAAEAQQKMQQEAAAFEQELVMKRQKAIQDMQINDAVKASKI
jgi:hypothetical protein